MITKTQMEALARLEPERFKMTVYGNFCYVHCCQDWIVWTPEKPRGHIAYDGMLCNMLADMITQEGVLFKADSQASSPEYVFLDKFVSSNIVNMSDSFIIDSYIEWLEVRSQT